MSQWNPGDRALFKKGAGADDIGLGDGTIVTLERRMPENDWQASSGVAWQIGPKKGVCQSCLYPIPDEYDGHQTTTWDECVWQPGVTA